MPAALRVAPSTPLLVARAARLGVTALVAAAFATPLLLSGVASADVAPAPKKKGCAIEAGAGETHEGAAAFGVCAAALLGAVVVRRARRKA